MSHLLEEYLNRKWFTTVYERSLTRWQRKIYKFNRPGPVEPVHRSTKKVKPENHEKFRMGKITTNPKSIESRERKAENAAAKKAAIQKAKEDASWEDNDKQLARKADRANAAVSFFLIYWISRSYLFPLLFYPNRLSGSVPVRNAESQTKVSFEDLLWPVDLRIFLVDILFYKFRQKSAKEN